MVNLFSGLKFQFAVVRCNQSEKNVKISITYFVLLPAYTTLLGKAKIGGTSEVKMNEFILYITRLALSLHPKYVKIKRRA